MQNRNGFKALNDQQFKCKATAADIVADPSAPDAFVQGIMEGKEWVWDGDILREMNAENTKKRIEKFSRKKSLTERRKLKLLNDFLSNL